jgi:GntR family transcriptional repressor for pyruvate dehydrogenase complex
MKREAHLTDEPSMETGPARSSKAPARPSRTLQGIPVEKGTLAERVYGVFLQRIITGSYAMGQRLPTEHTLCAEFGVSRPVLRGAMTRLREEGWIQSRQGSGSVVTRGPENHPLGFSRIGTLADIQRCFEFRMALEPEAAAHAARRRGDADLTRIKAALDLLRDAVRDHRHREDADFAFHLAIAQSANNHYFWTTLNALNDHVAVGMKLHGLAVAGPNSALAEVYEEHFAIFAAIRDGDAGAARVAMHDHLATSRARLFDGHDFDLAKARS